MNRFRTENAVPTDAAEDRAVRRWLLFALFASIFLQRFGVPIGQYGIGLNLFLTLLSLGAIAMRGALQVDGPRAALVFAFAACVWFSAALRPGGSALTSAALAMLIYLPYALALRRPEGMFEACIRAFQTMVFVCALAGIAQFLAQFALDPALLFTFDGLLPEAILLKGWGTMQPMAWGGSIYRANGFFLNEPSVFSQYLALAILIEVLFFGRVLRLLTFGVAILLSYSGTGLLLLAIMLPWVMLRARAYKALAGLGILALAAVALGDVWGLDVMLRRLGEFGRSNTSATARYEAGGWLISSYILSWPPNLLFGLGPGSFLDHARQQSFEAHDNAVWKLLFEYGVVGSVVFAVLFVSVVFERARSRWVSTALTIGFLVFGGTMLDPRLQVLILLFCALTKKPAIARGSPAAGFALHAAEARTR